VEQLRKAGAVARAMLVAAGRRNGKAPGSEIRVSEGRDFWKEKKGDFRPARE